MVAKQIRTTPELRFPEFKVEWITNRVDYFIDRHNDPVSVEGNTLYRQIGVRSHGRGVFHKDEVTGSSLGSKRVFWVHPQAFVVNIVFGWEQAVALTTEAENGFIASHRFPMFVPKENRVDLTFFLTFFLCKRGKYLLGLASPGGAGRNKTLGQNEFSKLEITLPQLEEQQKIAAFLGAVDNKLTALRRKRELLQEFKRGMMQKIFSRELRFKREDGSDFPDWEEKRLGEVFTLTRGQVLAMPLTSEIITEEKIYPVYSSQTKRNGLAGYYNEYLFEDAITWTTDGANAGETKFRKGKFYCTNVCGVLLNPDGHANSFIAELINSVSHRYVSYVGNPKLMNNVMSTIRISFADTAEQQKIADFLSAIDTKIESVAKQIGQVETFKKGLLQKMFV